MSTSEPFADHGKSRLRGDMYLRAEQRKREELEEAEAAAAQNFVATRETAATEYVTVVDTPLMGGTWAPPSAGPAIEAAAPAAVEPARVEAQPSRSAGAIAPVPVATPTVRRAPRRQQTLMPAAALGAVAIIATLGVALTLSPGDNADGTAEPLVKVASTAAATAPAPAPAAATAPAPAAATAPASANTTRAATPAPAPAQPALTPPGVAKPSAANPTTAPVAASPAAKPGERSQPAVMRTARAASSAPRALDGQIRVTSIPAGARVTVDGIGWGQTPVTVRNVAFGRRTIRVTHDGYASQQAIVQVSGDTPTRAVEIALRRK